ncbi:hypothetical protein GCM10009760_62310 [Kitasatospora kazusensis]|uniref:Uncharacterized protein n=1 Tax=Kitasatospora kazusensis TaxID=407974 RepID=A0ABP4KAV5_9ACTN
MAATVAAPDPTADERWQQLEDRLENVRERLQSETGGAIDAINVCLARHSTLRQDLIDHPWTSTVSATAAEAPTAHHGSRQPGRHQRPSDP